MGIFNLFKRTTDYANLIPKAKLIKKIEPNSARFHGNLNINGTGVSPDRFIRAELTRDEIESTFRKLGLNVFAVDYSVSGKTETHALYAPAHKLSQFLKDSFLLDLQGELGLRDKPIVTSLTGEWLSKGKPIRKNIIELTIERANKVTAHLGDYLKAKSYWDTKGDIVVPFGHGKESIFVDLAKMPHALVVGTSGSGKSVFLESLLLALHHRYTAEEVQVALIDPKRVELVTFANSPLLFSKDGEEKAFYTDADKAVEFLMWLNSYIDRRYRSFAEKKVKNIAEHNKKFPKKKVPYIVCVIDEFAKLTETDGSADLFKSVRKITAEARAAGIILIIATQTPNKDVLPIQIRTNLQTRIAFRIADKVDAESIVRIPEAFDLVGRGDGIYLDSDGRKHRFSGCFLDSKVDKLDDIITWDR